MLNEYYDLIGKKLLVIGSSECDANIVRAAHELGVYVIAVDGNKKSKSTFAKTEADESWDIDYTNVDEIGKKCIESRVDGVLAGYSEFRVSAACKIAEYIGSPFYATCDQIELTRNKRRFKDECRKYGVNVPNDYYINLDCGVSTSTISHFPVIIKPTDAAGRKGISICQNQADLEDAIIRAQRYSVTNEIIVEDYITGTEFVAVYTLQDGNYSLSCFNQKYLNQENKQSGLCDLSLTPSAHLQLYLNRADKNIRGFLRGIDARNGVAFFQGIATSNEIFVFEMGYRLNGGNDYFISEIENGISYMKMLISHSLTGTMIGDLKKDNPFFSKYYANFLIYAHEGQVGTIKYTGKKNKIGIGDVHIKLAPGMTVIEDGTTAQCAFTFKLIANTIGELIELIKYCQNHSFVEDNSGKNLLFRPFSVNSLR